MDQNGYYSCCDTGHDRIFPVIQVMKHSSSFSHSCRFYITELAAMSSHEKTTRRGVVFLYLLQKINNATVLFIGFLDLGKKIFIWHFVVTDIIIFMWVHSIMFFCVLGSNFFEFFSYLPFPHFFHPPFNASIASLVNDGKSSVNICITIVLFTNCILPNCAHPSALMLFLSYQ